MAGPGPESPEEGTMIIAALLLLALGFAGYWIAYYASSGGPPWDLAGWFAIGAGFIIVVGLLTVYRRGRRKP